MVVNVFAPGSPPGEVSPPGSTSPRVFLDTEVLSWEPGSASGAERFNGYRGYAPWLRDGLAGSCLLGGVETQTASDAESPQAGECLGLPGHRRQPAR